MDMPVNQSPLSSGICTEEGMRAAAALRDAGIKITHYHISTLKPFDHPEIVEAIAGSRYGAITFENHSIIGGLGSAVADVLAESGAATLKKIGVQDRFGESGPAAELLHKFKLDAEGIIEGVKGFLA